MIRTGAVLIKIKRRGQNENNNKDNLCALEIKGY
jgi:hypothetical protein